jgi:hypothetical protein
MVAASYAEADTELPEDADDTGYGERDLADDGGPGMGAGRPG